MFYVCACMRVSLIGNEGVVIMTDSVSPEKKTKAELEQIVKANGGNIFQTHTAAKETICIAERSK